MKTEVTRGGCQTPVISRWEWLAVIGLLLVGAALRLIALNDVPPGPHHDEVIIGQVAKDILRGHLAIYFTAGYGHEPLYHYLVAGVFAVIGASAFALRLTSAFVAIVGLAVAYRFARRLFSPAVALGTLAWMSIALWPVFFARVGLRGITLPLLTTLTALALWRALHTSRLTHYVVAGALLGLTLYTYQASRVFPVIFAVFFVYLVLTRPSVPPSLPPSIPPSLIPPPSSLVSGVIAFFATALLIAAPLIVYLTAINPAAEERVADLSGPLTQLRDGDPSAVIRSTLNTLGMFTIAGDAVPIYNVSQRPVFPEPIGAALFYLGLLICVWRWRQPACAFMVIWFFISLAPAMVTPFSPNFVRTLAVWPAPFVFVGLGMQSSSQVVTWLNGQLVKRSKRHLVPPSLRPSIPLSPHHLVTLIFTLVMAFNTVLTTRDYFLDWPRGDYVRFWQQATWTQAARALNADPASSTVAASGLNIHDLDPQTFDLLGLRSDLKVKWFDCRTAWIAAARYLEPDFLPCDADWMARFLPGAAVIAQPRWPDSGNIIFTLRQFTPPMATRPTALRPVWIGGESFDAQHPAGDLEPRPSPIDWSGVRLLGWETDREEVQPGGHLDVCTHWQLRQAIAPPLKTFLHVTAPDGRIVAQWDGLDVNVGTLEVGDVFIQRHRIDLPLDLPPGPYRVSLGVYHSDTGTRLTAQIGGRTVDSIVLTTLEVK